MKKLNLFHFSLGSVPTLVGALFALTFFIGIGVTAHVYATSDQASADGQKLVTIHDGGETRGIVTKDETLREVFRDAGVPITDQDLVEPGLDTKLTVNNYEVNVYRARPITVVDGQVKKRVMSPYRTARQIVEHAGMTLHDEDRTTLSANPRIIADGPGLVLTIDRATPFTLVLYGKKLQAYTQASTVGAMLEEKNITLGPKDDTSVPLDTAITEGMTVKIWRNGVQTVTRTETIKFHVKQIKDADQPVGYKKVTTPGKNGKKEVTYQLTMRDGKVVKKKKIQSVTMKKPVEQVEVVGTKPEYTPYTGGGSMTDWLKAAGIARSDWGAAQRLIGEESGWNPNARNSNSGACGLAQALPCSKVPGNPLDPVDSLRWANGYVQKYGGWNDAWAYWQANRYY